MDVSNDILTLAALVASYVGVAKGFGLTDKFTHLVALLVAAVFVLVPDSVQSAIITVSVVGLTASGAYHYTKKRDENG
jgi:predicted metal-binding membrane protein